MRYLLHESQETEVIGRQVYLYDIFHLFFSKRKPEGGFLPLVPIGSFDLDVLFITGHTPEVHTYLEMMIDNIPESRIVITSCMGEAFREFAAKKEIFVPDAHNSFCKVRNGLPYGFDFKISDAELDFYNSSGKIIDRIQKSYVRLQYKEKI